MPNVEVPGATLYYEVEGEGPAVVFGHGAGGNRMSWWQQVPAFVRDHRVIRFDHRSFGRSRCDPGAFDPTHFGDDLRAILDNERIDRASLVCQSLGGWTGVRMALESPERVSSLVLCGTPGGIAHPKVLEAAASIGDRIQAEGVRGSAALAPGFEVEHPELAYLYDQISALNTHFDMDSLGAIFAARGRIPVERAAELTVPVLMVMGGRDLLFPIESLRAVAEAIPGAETAEFLACGHSVYFEAAAEFNGAVRAFVERHEKAS